MALSRRDFLKVLSATGAGVTLGGNAAFAKDKALMVEDPRHSYPNSSYTENMYRKEFAYTYGKKEEHGTAYHCVNCQGNCAWDVWVDNGIVTRENQVANYPQINAKIPDFNPRGCNKGVQHSQIMYEKDRILYPLKRVGKRGEGKWKRITWDEAVTEIAEKIYETMLNKGPEGLYIHVGAGMLTEGRAASGKRLGALLGAVRPYIASYVGDMFQGVSVVYGEGNVGCTWDFQYVTDVQIYWGMDPNKTRIPDAHFVWEGKYNGSKVIVISPEFNATAIHADLWIPVRAGYDSFLAMSVMNEIFQKKLYKPQFIKIFTDLPFLVRLDNKKLLRLSDIDVENPPAEFDEEIYKVFEEKAEGGEFEADACFFSWNTKTNKLTLMPGTEGNPIKTLRLKDVGWDIDPALEGKWEVTLKDGTKVPVTTVFELVKAEAAKFPAEKTHKLTNVHPKLVEQLAIDLTQPKVVNLNVGFTLGKYFNGLLGHRNVASLPGLSGRLGPYGGLNTENEVAISGMGVISSFAGKYKHRFASGFVSEYVLGNVFESAEKLYSDEDIKRGTGWSKDKYLKTVKDILKKTANDEGNKNVKKTDGKPYWTTVETFLLFADARFRRNKGGTYKEAFLKKAKFLAYVDFRMSDFATYADIVLPAKSHYEVWDIRTNPGYHRFANLAQPPQNLKPVGEAKDEWSICTMIVEKLEEIAKKKYKETGDERYIKIPDEEHLAEGGYRPMDKLVELYTEEGKLRTDFDAVKMALENVDQFKPNTVESMRKRGGFLVLNEKAGKSSPLYPDKPYNSFENNLYLFERFETLSGRLTYYVDHDLWIELGANVPTAREPIRPKKYPFVLMTPHARWSIHSTYKTSKTLLRLQRGKPYVMINPEIAKKKGIKDGDEIRVFNNIGEFYAMAKVYPSAPKDAVLIEHGWEPFFFKNKKNHNDVVGDLLNLLELSDGWGHLKFGGNWDGNQHAYETSVDIEKA